MILQKSLKEPPATAAAAAAATALGFGSSSATILGIKVIGGKLFPDGRTGAVIDKVKKGSIADTVGRLLPGDEVLEWNGRSLVDRSYEEVHSLISESRHDPQVELRVSRLLVGAAAQVTAVQHRASNRPAVTVSDPLGGTHMLNPNVAPASSVGILSAAGGNMGTRIQVGTP